MDAVKFLKEKNRMCKEVTDCFNCPLGNKKGGCQVGCRINQIVIEEQLVEIVKKWAAEHPRKTRQSEFLKIYPGTVKKNGIIGIEPCKLENGTGSIKCCLNCDECRESYWLTEVEE